MLIDISKSAAINIGNDKTTKAIELGRAELEQSKPKAIETAYALLIVLSAIASLLVWITFAESIVAANSMHPFTYDSLKTIFDFWGMHIV